LLRSVFLDVLVCSEKINNNSKRKNVDGKRFQLIGNWTVCMRLYKIELGAATFKSNLLLQAEGRDYKNRNTEVKVEKSKVESGRTKE
jgi:hypothetical protein